MSERNNIFFGKDADLMSQIGINPYDAVFYKGKPLSEHFKKAANKGENLDELSADLAEKLFEKKKFCLFISRLGLTDGLYSFSPPELFLPDDVESPEKLPKIPKAIAKHIEKTEKNLIAVNNAHMRKLMISAKKNAEFITRFNSELFFRHSYFGGKQISVNELFDFYETHPYYLTVNLAPDADKQPFIALYAMTFYNCSQVDLFSIDGIFSMQPERHADNAKKTAGNAVFNLILRNDSAEIEQVLFEMGQTVIEKIHTPRVNLLDAVMLSKNYAQFVGLSEIGRVFAAVAEKNNHSGRLGESIKAAQSLMKYSALVSLCDAISVLSEHDDYRDSTAYKRCSECF